MQEHIHTGPASILINAVGVIIVLNVARIVAAWLVDKPQTEWLGRGLGGLITFSGDTSEVS